jgi:tetratricopeptide (TPR) repeat protein
MEADPQWVPDLPSSDLRGGLQRKSLFDLPASSGPRVPPGAVSVDRLRKPIPRKAKKAYQRASKFRENSEFAKAESEYKLAISYFPEYMEAHGDLGVLYVFLHRYIEAEAEIRRGIEIQPQNTIGYSNLAWTLAALGKIAEAEKSARKALEYDAENPQAHLLLGAILIGYTDTKAEGFKHLQIAAKSLPGARKQLQELQRP